jgi:hypothetical protein
MITIVTKSNSVVLLSRNYFVRPLNGSEVERSWCLL